MAEESVLRRFEQLGIWKRGDERAPHKPLLVLYALGRWSRGDRADIPFSDVSQDLTELLREFGPPRQSYHPEYPFWWLQSDQVWVVSAIDHLGAFPSGTGPSKSVLLAHNVHGSFSDDVKSALTVDPILAYVFAIVGFPLSHTGVIDWGARVRLFFDFGKGNVNSRSAECR